MCLMNLLRFWKLLFINFWSYFYPKILKMVPLEYTKKPKIIVVRQMQILQYKALNSKFNCNFLSFGI